MSCILQRLVYCRAPAVSSSAHHPPYAPPALGETPDRETEIKSQVTLELHRQRRSLTDLGFHSYKGETFDTFSDTTVGHILMLPCT